MESAYSIVAQGKFNPKTYRQSGRQMYVDGTAGNRVITISFPFDKLYILSINDITNGTRLNESGAIVR